MKELEDTKSETRRVLDLRFSIWDRLNNSLEEDAGSPIGSPRYNSCATPLGDFFGDAAYAWLSCGPRLAIIDVKTGTSICFWTFRDRVTCVSPFPSQLGQVPMLLVGLDNGASKLRDSSGMICVFDCSTTQVLRAVRMPAGVEQLCVVIGGAEWEDFGDERIHNFPVENSGLACVALRNLDHLMIDLRRSSWDGPDVEPIADEASPAELDLSGSNETTTSRHNRYGRAKHVAYNLMNNRVEQYIGFSRERYESSSLYQESLTSSMICSRKIGCLVSGCLGRIIIWQMDGVVRWVSPPTGENVSITNLALLEPTDDPRPFCYLWASHQEESSHRPPVLRMYAMLFERKFSDKGSNAYLKLKDDPSQHFELELEPGERVASLHSIVRESNPEQTESGNKRGEENLLLISLDSRTLLFDLNQWYKEQMPRTVGDCQNANAFLASYRTSHDARTRADEAIVNSTYVPATLKEFRSHTPSPAEELFYPNSLCLEWIELGSGRLTFRMTRGVQNELLRDISLAGPVILLDPSETYHRCLVAGLIPPNAECSFNSDKDGQRDTLLSLCLEQYWSSFLLRCAKEWSDGSASYLFQSFLRWAYQRAVSIKLTADRYCVPLFDESDTSIGESEVRTLRCLAQQSECISHVMTNLFVDNVELTKERRSLRRISTYLQVLLWFYDVGLLPETQKIDDAGAPPLSFSLKIPYPFVRLATIYKEKREQFNAQNTRKKQDNEEDLFIDELLTRECPSLKLRWEREGCDDRGEDSEIKRELCLGGNYPPASLQTLLRSYLTDFHNVDSHETENKHQITTYLLMDLAMLLQESYPESIHKTLVEQLIKYPSAFKLSPSFIQLTQALWRLDHENYEGFLNIMTSQLVADTDVKDWHHKLIMRTLIRNNQNKLALVYLRVRKPPLSSLDDQGIAISLTVEHGLPQSAFHRRPPSHYAQLLTRFFRACKVYGRLNDILHLALNPEEEEAFVKFLEDEKSEDMRLLYYLQRCRYTEASNVYPSNLSNARGNFYRSNKPSSLVIFNAYNATLPDITRKFSNNAIRRIHDIDPDSRYPRPLSHRNSRCTSRDIHETVVRKVKETFIRGDRTQIPFVSAPCSSLRTGPSNIDTNAVHFVERTKKPYGKRCLDEMRSSSDDGMQNDNNGEERKRRKTSGINDTPDAGGSKELGMSMVFDTPLIKRKNQMINARSTPMERPHSILKIRQMIRESASPSIVEKTTELPVKKIVKEEKKPRQIRFSIGQQRAEESVDEAAISDSENCEKNMAQDDVNEESDETEKSLSKCDASEAEEDEIEEPFFSPNVSNKSQESTILSDSSYVSRNMSGPRPRPSLRRSTLSSNESASDLLRRSLMKSRDVSMRASNDSSIRDTNTSFTTSNLPGSPKVNNSLFFTSTYSETILSPDTSFECTASCYETKGTKLSTEHFDSFVERTADKIRNFSTLTGTRERNENLSRFSKSVTVKTTSRTSVTEEYSRDGEEDKNSEIVMVFDEVDDFGLDRDSDTRSQHARESNWELDKVAHKQENFVLSMTQISAISEVSETKENHSEAPEVGNKDEKFEDLADTREQRDDGDGWTRREVSIVQTEEIVEETEATEDYEDELLALKYDEDEEPEEAFQSLTNSMEVDRSSALLTSERSAINDVATEKKLSSNNGFCDDSKMVAHQFTITDDESSRSVDGSVLSGTTTAFNNPRDDKPLEKKTYEDIHDDASNITDDESEASRDSSIFTSKNRRGPMKDLSQEENSYSSRINTNEVDESSRSSSIFSRVTTERLEEQTVSRISEIPNETEDSSHDSPLFSNKKQETNEAIANESSSSFAETVTSIEGKESEKNEFSTESSPATRKSARISKIGSFTPRGTARRDSEAADTTPLRMTRSRRASSIAQESLPSPTQESPTVTSKVEKTGRLRRGSSLVKDLFANSDNNLSRIASSESEEPPDPPPMKKGRLQRSTSLAKEIFATKSDDLPIRRGLRRAASVQKEIPEATSAPKLRTRASSKASLIEDTADEETLIDTAVKKNTRSKRGSSVSKESKEPEVAPRRLTRASSLAKEIPEVSEEIAESPTKRPTRRRGSSVPKETPNESIGRASSQRTRRGGSVTKVIIPEESSEFLEESKKISTRGKTNEATSPISVRRSRLSSITSIAEEDDDEIFGDSSSAKQNAAERRKAATTRERRAISVDAPLVDVKRRTRASTIKSAISENPIEEENSDSEIAPVPKNTVTRKAPARRKRTASGTSLKDLEDHAEIEKLPQRRTRKLSQRSNESTSSVKVSSRDIDHGRPDDDEKETDEVPVFGVSEPRYGKSKYPTPNQPRRKLKDFIPLTEEEKKAADEPFHRALSRRRLASTDQRPKPFWFDIGKGFVLPRSKSTSD